MAVSRQSLSERLQDVRERIAAACARARRDPAEVRLMAVTKTQPPEAVALAASLGLTLLGENRVQEAEWKSPAVAALLAAAPGQPAAALEWHLIGPLQSNKAARAAALFQVVQTLDRPELAQRLDRLHQARTRSAAARDPLPVMLEINLAREPQKHGAAPDMAPSLADAVLACSSLHLCGLMTVPPDLPADQARPYFAQLRELSIRLRQTRGLSTQPWALSMGMSHDYEVAIEEGATLVRLGTALFGPRGSIAGPR